MKPNCFAKPLVAALLALSITACRKETNSPPDRPPPPTGESRGYVDTCYNFSAATVDPDEDSICYRFVWGDGDTSDWGEYAASGSEITVSHAWDTCGTHAVKAQARDNRDALSAWSEAMLVAVADTHPVKWFWTAPSGDLTSPVIIHNGSEYLILVGCDEEFYAVGLDGRMRSMATSVVPDGGFCFLGHPAWCEASGNVIVGNEEGELYAFTPDLSLSWHWPGNNRSETFDELAWGTPAIIGDRIYVPRDDSAPDCSSRLHCFIDIGTEGALVACCTVPGDDEIIGAPVIDHQGNVLFTTLEGYLYKLDPDLDTVLWDAYLGGEPRGPIIGADGSVYCANYEDDEVVAFDPDGGYKWAVEVSHGPSWPVLDSAALYVATDEGLVHSLDQEDGSTNWVTELEWDIVTSPVLGANGVLYCLDYDEVLYCLDRTNGNILWQTDCTSDSLDRHRGGRDIEEFEPSPTIAPNGDIIVPTGDGLVCVKGYPGIGLADTPWPKWQRDLHNTGNAASQ